MDNRKLEHLILIFLCFLVIVPVLYIFRFADTNTFTSWKWVFTDKVFLRTVLLLFPALAGAYALSRKPLQGPQGYMVLFFLSFAATLPLWGQPETILDASRYFLQAKALKEYGAIYFFREWGRAITAWTDLPLVPFIFGLVFSWIGEARVYIQALTSMLFSLTVVLTCLIGKKIWDEETGLHAGMLLLGIPYLLVQVPLMLVDVPTMFFMALSVYLFLCSLQEGGTCRAIASGLAITMALFCKFSTLPMLLIVPVMPFIFFRENLKTAIKRTLAVLLVAGLFSGTLIASNRDILLEQIMLLKTYQLPGLSRWGEGFVSTFLYQIHPFITCFALYGTYRAIRQKDARFLIAGWFMIAVVFLRVTRIRYMIPLFPLFVLMASYGLNRIRDSGSRRFIALCIAASSLVIACGAYLPYLNSTSLTNLKKAGEYLDAVNSPSAEVYVLPQRSSSGSTIPAIALLDYYSDKKIVSPQDWQLLPGYENARQSSLRFTWEMKKPAFYSASAAESARAIVVIADQRLDKAGAPSGFRVLKIFDAAVEDFKYQTIVTVYGKD